MCVCLLECLAGAGTSSAAAKEDKGQLRTLMLMGCCENAWMRYVIACTHTPILSKNCRITIMFHTHTHTHTPCCYIQFLCECIRGLLREPLSSSKMSSTFTSVALKELRRMAPSVSLTHLELAELDDFVFLLSDLWSLDTDGIRVHWVSNLFAAGRDGHGKKVRDLFKKSKVVHQKPLITDFPCH